MVAEARTEKSEPESLAAAVPNAAKWSTNLGHNGLIVLLALSVVANAAGFAYLKFRERSDKVAPSTEIALGSFRFVADKSEKGLVNGARFSLHVAFTPQADQEGRQRLSDRKYRVQQDIEELLRRAHGADFDDPRLRDLKRQVQQQINETLGIQALADVIITDLSIDWSASAPPGSQTAENAPAASRPNG